jgi:hypothetical protein
MEKPYWDQEDYDNVIREIEFRTPEGERFPTFNDPETSPVINKLISRENVAIVVEDETLGLRHRAQFAQDMFDEYRDLARLYHVMDREDKFVYDLELVEIQKFGLYLEVYYFKLGNDQIIQESDTPDDPSVQHLVKSNEQIIVKNFNNYLDFVNQEKSFSEESLDRYVAGIKESYDRLLEAFPDADYAPAIEKAQAMEKKALNAGLKSSLNNLIDRLKAKKQTPGS